MLLTYMYTLLALRLRRNVVVLSVGAVAVSLHSRGSGIPGALLSSLLSFRVPLHKGGQTF